MTDPVPSPAEHVDAAHAGAVAPDAVAPDAVARDAIPPVMTPLMPPSGSGCPPPLAWTDVLTRVREERLVFEIHFARGHVHGFVFGQGTPLYFLGNETCTPEVFCLTAWLLRDQFRCVFIGYPDNPRDMHELGGLISAVADHLGDASVDVFAAGFGTMVLLETLRQHPARVGRIVLQAPLISTRLSAAERFGTSVMKRMPCRMERMPFLARTMQNNHGLWFPPIDETRWQFLVLDTARIPMPVVARRLKLMHGKDYGSQLEEVAHEVLVISCEGDSRRHRAAAEAVSERVPKARLEIISNSGQVPFVTHPHRLVSLIRSFLQPAD